MPTSIELIVEGYVRINDRSALVDLLAHRRKVLKQLQSVTGIDPKQTMAQISQDIAVIERTLAALAG